MTNCRFCLKALDDRGFCPRCQAAQVVCSSCGRVVKDGPAEMPNLQVCGHCLWRRVAFPAGMRCRGDAPEGRCAERIAAIVIVQGDNHYQGLCREHLATARAAGPVETYKEADATQE